ncbi:hypothetical protein F443_13302 [Phytophthora nicotianae P1569]|uniref:Uncharacterized protein n=2 Tax=Phytophthora nicotianae TaxID=4792 RepID=V9EQE4_PHYNI|nr:hypothetical protein F443_13302 [Phytophthora nicotianae P1569]ETO70136.1 hypothetical protein F444_13377 [Phytophthora nicotianae P1976]
MVPLRVTVPRSTTDRRISPNVSSGGVIQSRICALSKLIAPSPVSP